MDYPDRNKDQQTDKSTATSPKPKAGVVPKRGSLLSSTTKPKSTTSSSLKAPPAPTPRQTIGTTLGKPPSRPSVSSTVKKSNASSTNAVSSLKPRGSVSSMDEGAKSLGAADEKKSKPALGAPKRLSTVGAITSNRFGADKKPVNQPITASERKSVDRSSTVSPSKNMRPLSSGPKPALKSHVSSLRAAGVGDGKKRLSTIPDSPAAVQPIQTEHEKENNHSAGLEKLQGKGLTRPPLGIRQSTRSKALSQSIREYELVNDMLQAAMAAEDAGDEAEKEQLTTEADEVITQLKADLQVSEETSSPTKPPILEESTESILTRKDQLREDQATISASKQPLDDPGTEMTGQKENQHVEIKESALTRDSPVAAHAVEIEEIKKQHESEVSSLHRKVHDLELSQQEGAEQALKDLESAKRIAMEAGDAKTIEAIEEQKHLHDKAVNQLEQELAIERRAIKESNDRLSFLEGEAEQHKAKMVVLTSETGEHKKATELCRYQLAEKDRELQSQGSKIQSVQKEINALQHARNAEAEDLKRSSEEEVARLKTQMTTLRSETDRLSEQSAASQAQSQEKLFRQEEEISKLNEVIHRLQDEVQHVDESKSTELDEKLFQARQDHDQLVTALKAEHQASFEGLAESHNAVIEKLATEARNVRTAHEAQIQTIQGERSETQRSLEESTNLLKESQQETATRMQEVDMKHTKALQAADEKVEAAEKALADSQRLVVETRDQAEQKIGSAVKELEEKLNGLEDESSKGSTALKNAHEDLEAAQQQVASLKQVLERVEKDNQSKEEYHNNSLKKVIAEAEAAAQALSEYSSNLDLAETKHAKAIQELKRQHENELGDLRKDLTQDHDQAFQELKTKYNDLTTAHAELQEETRTAAESQKVEHDQALADSSKLVADLKQAHQSDIDEIKSQAAKEHLEASKQLEKDFSQKCSDLDQGHLAALDNLRIAHEETLSSLRRELEDVNRKSKEIAKESDNAVISDLQAQVEELNSQFARSKLEALESPDATENSDVVQLQGDLLASENALTTSQSEIARLSSEVEDLKECIERDQETIKSLGISAAEKGNARADVSSQEVYMLKEQLDGAFQEAEIQRVDSDDAKKKYLESDDKVNQLTAYVEELEAKLRDRKEIHGTESKTTTPTSSRRRYRNKGSKSSPRLSLNRDTGPHDEGEVAASPAHGGQGENAASSVQGTMASIQEQVRQLDEVNEEMLEGHARVATMLSKVPDSPIPPSSTPMAS